MDLYDKPKNINFKENINFCFMFLGYLLIFLIFLIPIIFSSISSISSLAFTAKQFLIERIFNKVLLLMPIPILFFMEFYILLISYSVAILSFYTFHYVKHKNIEFQTAHLWILSVIYLPLFLILEFFYIFISIFI